VRRDAPVVDDAPALRRLRLHDPYSFPRALALAGGLVGGLRGRRP
jgi:hypothetical protein